GFHNQRMDVLQALRIVVVDMAQKESQLHDPVLFWFGTGWFPLYDVVAGCIHFACSIWIEPIEAGTFQEKVSRLLALGAAAGAFKSDEGLSELEAFPQVDNPQFTYFEFLPVV